MLKATKTRKKRNQSVRLGWLAIVLLLLTLFAYSLYDRHLSLNSTVTTSSIPIEEYQDRLSYMAFPDERQKLVTSLRTALEQKISAQPFSGYQHAQHIHLLLTEAPEYQNDLAFSLIPALRLSISSSRMRAYFARQCVVPPPAFLAFRDSFCTHLAHLVPQQVSNERAANLLGVSTGDYLSALARYKSKP